MDHIRGESTRANILQPRPPFTNKPKDDARLTGRGVGSLQALTHSKHGSGRQEQIRMKLGGTKGPHPLFLVGGFVFASAKLWRWRHRWSVSQFHSSFGCLFLHRVPLLVLLFVVLPSLVFSHSLLPPFPFTQFIPPFTLPIHPHSHSRWSSSGLCSA